MSMPVGITNALDAQARRRLLLGRRWWRLWVLTGQLVALGGVAILWQRPVWTLTAVTYDGPPVWEEKARSLVSLPADSNFLHVDVDAIQTRLEEVFGEDAEVRVKLTLPNWLAIRLQPIEPELWTIAGTGVARDGAAVVNPVVCPSRPVWRSAASGKSEQVRGEQLCAAGCWAEVLAIDPGFRQIVSEWRFDRRSGWVMTMADGRTRVLLGRGRLSAKADFARRVLAMSDSVSANPCLIDTRFDGQVVVRALNSRRAHANYKEANDPIGTTERHQGRDSGVRGREGA